MERCCFSLCPRKRKSTETSHFPCNYRSLSHCLTFPSTGHDKITAGTLPIEVQERLLCDSNFICPLGTLQIQSICITHMSVSDRECDAPVPAHIRWSHTNLYMCLSFLLVHVFSESHSDFKYIFKILRLYFYWWNRYINISHILKVVLSLFKVLHMVQGITDYYI